MAHATATRRLIEATYSEARGRAMSMPTWRLRLRERRLPSDTNDPLVLARRRAIRYELRDRKADGCPKNHR